MDVRVGPQFVAGGPQAQNPEPPAWSSQLVWVQFGINITNIIIIIISIIIFIIVIRILMVKFVC
jgi:uncharacterized membrane protein YdbT with pleckstrin-like domain